MRFIIRSFLIAALLLLPSLPGTAQVPAQKPVAPSAVPAAAQPAAPSGQTLAPSAPAAASPAPAVQEQTITKDDYQLYLKSGDRNPSWDEYIEPAFTSFDSENFATAGIFLAKAYEKGCRDPLVMFRLGIYRESRRQFKEAAELLSQAADGIAQRYPGHPLNNSIALHAGRALYQIDDYVKALPYLQKALQQNPNDFMILLMLGQIARSGKLYAEARSLFERAIASKPPENVTPNPVRTVLGELIILTYALKDSEACQKYVDMVLSAWPRDPVANTYRTRLDKERFEKKQQEMLDKIVK